MHFIPSSSNQCNYSRPSCLLVNKMKGIQRSKRITKPIKTVQIKSIANDPKSLTIVKPKSKSKPRLRAEHDQNPKNEINPLLLLSNLEKSSTMLLNPDFYRIDALELAPRLLGKYLKRDEVVLQITEVEAYRSTDSACHGRFGITPRTAPMFGPGGHAYVYLCYGLHSMLNIVAEKEGVGAAVLIRSCTPVSGLETIQQRRGLKSEKSVLLTGPGKIGQALGISRNGPTILFTPQVLDGPEPEKILVGPRVGIDYALPEHVNALWRFAIDGTSWISGPKNTLRPL